MTAKEFFQSVREADHRLASLRQQRQQIEQQAFSMGGMSETNIRSPGNRSRVESAALRLVELDEAMGEAAEHYADLMEQAQEILSQVENTRHYEVLSYRYVCGMSWKQVAEKMGYTGLKSVFQVHGWALMEAQKIMDRL